jgi:hypothetical protein
MRRVINFAARAIGGLSPPVEVLLFLSVGQGRRGKRDHEENA